jgi:hypothetical protein
VSTGLTSCSNFSQQNHYCQTCGRAFKRLDLLQRHEKRQICTASDFPRPKRTRSASGSSGEGEDEYGSNPPYTATSQSYSNPYPSASSFFPDNQPSSVNMGNTNVINPHSTSTMSDQSNYQPDLTIPQPENQGGDDVEFKPDTTDFGLGFGVWPPENWEALFDGEVQPPWLDSSVLSVEIPYQTLTPRMQESSERHQVSLANAALLVKIQTDFPVSHIINICPMLTTRIYNLNWISNS